MQTVEQHSYLGIQIDHQILGILKSITCMYIARQVDSYNVILYEIVQKNSKNLSSYVAM